MNPPSTSTAQNNSDNNINQHDDLSKYGLGNTRTLKEYMEFCGVDFQNRRIKNSAKLGGLKESAFVDPIVDMVMKSSPLVPLDE